MKKRQFNIYAVTELDKGKLTDTAVAMIDKQLRILCFQSLKTNYANSGNVHLLEIMQSAFQSSVHENNADYREIVENEHCGVQLMEIKRHNHKRINGINIPVKPYETIELTSAGKEYLQDTIENKFTECTITFDDLLHTAWQKVLELNSLGIITEFDSVWTLRKHIYKAINSEIHVFKRNEKRNICIDDITVSDEKAIETLDSVDVMKVLDTLETQVKKLVNARMDSETAWKVWKYNKLGKVTKTELAKRFHVDEKQIRRYILHIQKIVAQVYNIA